MESHPDSILLSILVESHPTPLPFIPGGKPPQSNSPWHFCATPFGYTTCTYTQQDSKLLVVKLAKDYSII